MEDRELIPFVDPLFNIITEKVSSHLNLPLNDEDILGFETDDYDLTLTWRLQLDSYEVKEGKFYNDRFDLHDAAKKEIAVLEALSTLDVLDIPNKMAKFTVKSSSVKTKVYPSNEGVFIMEHVIEISVTGNIAISVKFSQSQFQSQV